MVKFRKYKTGDDAMSGKGKSSATGTIVGTIIILLLLLLIIIALIILLRGGDSGQQPAAEPEPTAELEEPTPTPKPTQKPTPTPTPTPSPTAEPSEEPPAPSPEETAKPSPSPSAAPKSSPTFIPPPSVAPAEGAKSSGSFSSNSGTSLNTLVSWNATPKDDGTVQLEVKLLLGACRIDVTQKATGAALNIGGTDYSFDTPAVAQESNDLSTHWLCTKSITLPYTPGMSVPISSVYHYGGTYNGVSIDDLTAEGSAVIS